MSFLGGIANVAGAVLGGKTGAGLTALGSYLGTASQNQAMANAADTAYENSIDAYQHRYQWQVADLKAAGLNPMLAYTNGAPSAPSAPVAQVDNPSQASINTGQRASELQASIDQMKASAEAQRAQAVLSQHLTSKADVESRATAAQAGLTELDLGARSTANAADGGGALGFTATLENRAKQSRAVTDAFKSSIDYNTADALLTLARKHGYSTMDAAMQDQDFRKAAISNRLLDLSIPEARAYADFFTGGVGRNKPYIDLGFNTFNSAFDAVNAFKGTPVLPHTSDSTWTSRRGK